MATQSMFPQRREAITDKVAAQQQNWGVQAPAPDAELTGLVRGLSELNPALHQYAQSELQASLAGIEKQKASIAALAQQQSDALDMQGRRATEFAGNPTPAEVPLALGNYYREAFHKALGEREGIKAKDAGMQAYNEAKEKPGFNVDAFLGEYRSTSLQGLESAPILAAQVGNQVNQLEVQLRADAQRQALLKHTETRNATVAQTFADELRPDLPPAALFSAYTTKLLPQAEALGLSKKEGAQFLLHQVTKVSDRLGGNAGLFDIFDRKDAEGISIASRNPEIAQAIESARSRAQTMADGKLRDDSQVRNFETMTKLETQLKADPASITLDVVKAHMGKAAPFATHDEAFGFWMKAQKAAEEQVGTKALQANYDNRTMYLLPDADQKKVLEANLGPYAVHMADAAKKGDVATVTTLAEQIMRAQSATGAKAPLEALENFINTTVTSMAGKAPSPAFEAAAAIYKAYSSDPAFREVYFKGDTAQVMKAYLAAEGGGDKEAAYAGAYRSISPEYKAAAAKMVDTPEWKKKSDTIVKGVTGSSMWPQWIGGNGRPENGEMVASVAAAAVREYYTQNPNSTERDAIEYARAWAEKNFIHDTTTNTAIRVPPNFGNEGTRRALVAYSKRIGDETRQRLSEANRDEWKVNFIPDGEAGQMSVYLVNGAAFKLIERKSLQSMIADDRFETGTTPAEKAAIGKIKLDIRNETVNPGFLQDNAAALAKAKRFGLFAPNEAARLEKLRSDEMMARVKAIPIMALGDADTSRLQFIAQRGARVDNKLTAQVASSFMTQAVASPAGMGSSLAGSLITMAEGTVLQAYPDPAKDAGNNIGMGYNLKANAKTAFEDLQRAGVPAEQVQAVIDGKAQLTQDQARRLLLVALPRYSDTASRAAEAAQPGLWQKMSPNQQAVMTDIAYSVGSADQFKRAWSAIANGDAEGFKAAVMTTYVNKDGVRVNDTRRFNLRAAMLAGTPNWHAVVQKYSGYPSNQLDSLALNAGSK